MAGMPYPPKCVLWAVHLCSVGAAETAAPTKHSVRSVHSVGEYSTTPWGKTQRGHGGMPCPLICNICLVAAPYRGLLQTFYFFY